MGSTRRPLIIAICLILIIPAMTVHAVTGQRAREGSRIVFALDAAEATERHLHLVDTYDGFSHVIVSEEEAMLLERDGFEVQLLDFSTGRGEFVADWDNSPPSIQIMSRQATMFVISSCNFVAP